ncbi:hypothetical protein Tco_0456518 [Tanacetum coccineum]
MGDENPIRTLGDYSKPSHEGYKNTIELPVGNNVVPLRSDTIRLVQNGCLFHGLRSEDPNQHLEDFLKLVDSLDLDDANRERTLLRLFQFSLRDQASNWLERLPAGSITTWEDLTIQDLALYDNESWNDLRNFAKPVKAITLPQDVLSTSDRHLIKLENQVQRLMEAHLAPMQPTQVNKVTTSWHNRNDDGIKWLDVEEPLDLVNTSEDDYDRGCRKPSDLEDGQFPPLGSSLKKKVQGKSLTWTTSTTLDV